MLALITTRWTKNRRCVSEELGSWVALIQKRWTKNLGTLQLVKVYVAGDCCVATGAELAYFVKCSVTARIFFFCPDCGCAWHEPPQAYEVEYIHAPRDYAQGPMTVPTLDEIVAAGRRDQIKSVVETSDVSSIFYDAVSDDAYDTVGASEEELTKG